MTDLVRIRNLHFKRNDRILFDGIDLEVPRGKITAIMGPSGCGKTTLLRLIGGQLQPDSGTIELDGQRVDHCPKVQLYKIRRELGVLFQSAALFTNITVFDNVAFPLREHTQLPEAMIRSIVFMKLHAVGLRGAAYLFPNELSGGMARRVALARAIALDPKLILYDEPFVGLDPIALGVIVKLIQQLNSALGITSILISHDVYEATRIAHVVYIIANGQIIGQGTPQQLSLDQNPQVIQFMQGLPDGIVPFHYPAQIYLDDLLD